jgi:octanoyl-[GcvH]:protein N-octanoyltransferase
MEASSIVRVAMPSGTAVGGGAPSATGACVEHFATAGLGLVRQEQMGERVLDSGRPLVMAWCAPRALLVGRTDARLPGFGRAVEELGSEGWPVFVRRSGGTACPVSPGTLQIALACRVSGGEIDAGYRQLSGLISGLLAGHGCAAETGERQGAFCPGRYDMGVGARKFAGLAQHWRPSGDMMVATTAASLIVEEDVEAFSRVVNRFYRLAGGKRRCASSAMIDVRRAMPGRRFADGDLMAELGDRLRDLI